MSEGAKKFDSDKPRYDLVPWDAVEQIVQVLTFGASKYDDRNWELGMDWGRLIAAAFRHLTAWSMGRDRDEESGLSHLAHAGACIVFLLAYSARNKGTDDRFTPDPEA